MNKIRDVTSIDIVFHPKQRTFTFVYRTEADELEAIRMPERLFRNALAKVRWTPNGRKPPSLS